MKAYALDLRERVLRARGRGHSAREVAQQFRLSQRSVERYWRRSQDTGQATARKMGGSVVPGWPPMTPRSARGSPRGPI